MGKLYLESNVLQAAKLRMVWIFDTFDVVSVSVSGGKDSSVLFDLAYREAQQRGRKINVFFLDQEAEYQSSINVVNAMMRRPGVIPHWYQIPMRMTNATSYQEYMLYAWHPEYKRQWVHPHVDISIKEAIPGVDRFYKIMEWVDQNLSDKGCILVGLRADESLNRYRTVTRHPAIPGIKWSSKIPVNKGAKLYPLYDWTFKDIWAYIGTEGIKYNRVYDWMYVKDYRLTEMRISNLIHEKAFTSLVDLQEFEPETYNRLLQRLKGIHVAANYAREAMMFSTDKLPNAFENWRGYRDFILSTYSGNRLDRFEKRFKSQGNIEYVYRQQVRQLLLNDWENNIPVISKKTRCFKSKWRNL